MPVGQGQIFASGISILLKGPNEALQIADGNPPVKYLHFVGADGQTIVPTYEPDGLDAGQGTRIGGAKLVMVSAAELVAVRDSIRALEDRVDALEEQLASATAANTPNALVRRDANGDIYTANFRGDIKEPSEGAMVKIKGFGGVEILRAGEIAGSPAKGWFGATLAIKQERSLSLSAVQDLIYLHETYGDVTVTP